MDKCHWNKSTNTAEKQRKYPSSVSESFDHLRRFFQWMFSTEAKCIPSWCGSSGILCFGNICFIRPILYVLFKAWMELITDHCYLRLTTLLLQF